MAHAAHDHDATHADGSVYYVPHHSRWPFLGSIALFMLMVGVANWMNGNAWGQTVFYVGLAMILVVLGKWFGDVIAESLEGTLQPAGGHLVPHGHVVVHLLGSDVLRRLLRRPVLRAPVRLAVAVGRRRRRADQPVPVERLHGRLAGEWPGRRSAATSRPSRPGACRFVNTLLLLSSGVTITLAHHALRAARRPVADVLARRDHRARRAVPLLPGRPSTTRPTPS